MIKNDMFWFEVGNLTRAAAGLNKSINNAPCLKIEIV